MNDNKSKKIKVLLTSCGGLTGTYLAKYFNGLKKYQLFGIDNNIDVVTKNWLDYFHQAPLVSDEKFSNFLYKYLNENSIDVIIPVTSYDIEYFANKFDHKKSKAKLMISSKNLLNELNDKKSCYELLKTNNISVPKIYNPQNLTYPCFAKPRKGTGSTGAVFVKNKLQVLHLSKL